MSIATDIRKDKIMLPCSALPATEKNIMAVALLRRVPDYVVKKVNIQSVCSDLMDHARLFPKTPMFDIVVPRPIPPFKEMWLEGRIVANREFDGFTGVEKQPKPRDFGIYTYRDDEDRQGTRQMLLLVAFRSRLYADVYPAFSARLRIESGELSPKLDFDVHVKAPFLEQMIQAQDSSFLHAYVCLATHTFARINCRNVELREIPGQYQAKRGRRPVMPMSYWHEIVVNSILKIRSTAKERAGTWEHDKIRSHWVRGHYADYTRGSGLFGKFRDIFWIPEHQWGDKETGTVQQNYTIGEREAQQDGSNV